MNVGVLPIANVRDKGDFRAKEIEIAEKRVTVDEDADHYVVLGHLGRIGFLAVNGSDCAKTEEDTP